MNSNYNLGNNSFFQNEREWNEPSHSIAIRKQSYALFNRVMIKGYIRRFLKPPICLTNNRLFCRY
jgi:hypothetical protein